MNDGEAIAYYFSILVLVTDQVKSRGKKATELLKVNKVLRALTAKFHPIVVHIEESNNLFETTLGEL